MFKCQVLYWLVLVVQSTLAYHVSPMPRGMLFDPGFLPHNTSPFTQMMDEQGGGDGNQNEVPLPLSLLRPGGPYGQSDFCNFGPFGPPSYGCPPFYGCMWGPSGPIGNRWPMPEQMKLHLAQKNQNFQQRRYNEDYEDPTTTYIDYYVEDGGDKEAEQKQKATRYSSRSCTTKKPHCRSRNKICIVG